MKRSRRLEPILLAVAFCVVGLAGCASQAGRGKPIDTACIHGGPTDAALELLVEREGNIAEVYEGPNGNPTAGVGHKLTTTERVRYPLGTTVPRSVRSAWLMADAESAWAVARLQADTIGEPCITEGLFAVIYQLGESWHTEHRRTWQYLVENRWRKASDEVRDSLWYGQTPDRVRDFQQVLERLARRGR